jgi:hypothetical protein
MPSAPARRLYGSIPHLPGSRAARDKTIDPPEGLIYRVERGGQTVLIAKWVRPGKVDGSYLPEATGKDALYHRGSR